MSEMTPWFPGDQKPDRVGVYETDGRGSSFIFYQFWNGEFWGVAGESIEEAMNASSRRSWFQNESWRGLSSDPAVAKEGGAA